MSLLQVCGTDDGSQIVGILNIVQKENKGLFPFVSGVFQDILHLGILVSCRIGDDALMLAGLRELIQTFPWYIFDQGIVFSLPRG